MSDGKATWNPNQYERFKAERAQPFRDLMAMAERRPSMRVVDLGCGTGETTRELHDALGARETLGIDSSAAMLKKSEPYAGGGLHFEQGDIETFAAEQPFDVVFSNAALHWVPDHPALYRRLAALVAPGGQLAVQIPANETHASHRVAAEVAQEFGIAPRVSPMLEPEEYATLLYALGAKRQHVRLQIYGHLLDDTRAVVEWVKGTLLTDYQRQLTAEHYETFLREYTTRLVATLGEHAPFFYTYRRVLMWAEL